ncbi:TIGR01458 family HAD-type hydrolase [Ferruginivarius sediminum]|uniref:Phospholysine phosphohistidine inorganic pyrophosphate phosphatase n=1 Tax=Ferruginivarius sediminum TaxID=2661937 RepID=A0A369TBM9_9PROT|nr:TIGR01458 family HAD-type hydrolase [Ferruginivarius sediminum]RDD62719.1 TIGR01458 family HAD-type hydrolase [Ferruginivarius sediminum]
MIHGVLLDLGGVIFVGDKALPGAVDAVARLRERRLPLRFITNTTRTPLPGMRDKLAAMGLEIAAEEMFMPAVAARIRLQAERLRPHLLVHPALQGEFQGLTGTRGTAVVIGDAGRYFDYDSLNAAFRALNGADDFLALARNRTFQDADGELSLDAGPFVAALEYASGRTATVLGKPSGDFFRAAVDSLGVAPETAVMVGDDAESDVAGAQAAGLQGILLRQGKYRAGDEAGIAPPPTAVLDDLPAAVDWILARAR